MKQDRVHNALACLPFAISKAGLGTIFAPLPTPLLRLYYHSHSICTIVFIGAMAVLLLSSQSFLGPPVFKLSYLMAQAKAVYVYH